MPRMEKKVAHDETAGQLPAGRHGHAGLVTITPNEVVSLNLRRIRWQLGWSQQMACDALYEMTGLRWSVPSWSAMERAPMRGRPRVFDASEILAFAYAFGVPPAALLVPPEHDPPLHVVFGDGTNLIGTPDLVRVLAGDRHGETARALSTLVRSIRDDDVRSEAARALVRATFRSTDAGFVAAKLESARLEAEMLVRRLEAAEEELTRFQRERAQLEASTGEDGS